MRERNPPVPLALGLFCAALLSQRASAAANSGAVPPVSEIAAPLVDQTKPASLALSAVGIEKLDRLASLCKKSVQTEDPAGNHHLLAIEDLPPEPGPPGPTKAEPGLEEGKIFAFHRSMPIAVGSQGRSYHSRSIRVHSGAIREIGSLSAEQARAFFHEEMAFWMKFYDGGKAQEQK